MSYFGIKVKYEAGNSLGRWDEEGEVGYLWEDLEDAKEALRRIKEYDRKSKKWFNARSKEEAPEWATEHTGIMAPGNGDDVAIIDVFWNGYFETLYTAEIYLEGEDVVYNTR